MTDKPIRQNEWKSSGAQWKLMKPEARRIRKEPTDAEARLGQELRGKKVAGVKFRRQHAIDRFIVDFGSSTPQIIVEVDGEIHESQREYDAIRDDRLRELGDQVLCFRNKDVLTRSEWVRLFPEIKYTRFGRKSQQPFQKSTEYVYLFFWNGLIAQIEASFARKFDPIFTLQISNCGSTRQSGLGVRAMLGQNLESVALKVDRTIALFHSALEWNGSRVASTAST